MLDRRTSNDPSFAMATQLDTKSVRRPDDGAASSPRPPSTCEVAPRRVDELRPNPRNPRTHSKRQIADLAKAIEAVGFIGTVIIDETGMILAGHARHAAAKLVGLQEVPTLCVRGLSNEQVRAFVLADNKFAERAGWDRELLTAELEELSVLLPPLNLDVSITGFETGEIDVLFADMGEETDAPLEDVIPPTARRAVSRPGDLWTLRTHRVLCGDARVPKGYARLMQGGCRRS